MRIIVDTNVLVSACIGGGAASKVMEACLRGKVVPVIGASLLMEYRDVTTREALFTSARLNQEERGQLLRAFVSRCEWQNVFFLWRPNLPDEGDNHVFELAVASNDATIITYNQRDFRRQELRFPHVNILSPEIFLQELDL